MSFRRSTLVALGTVIVSVTCSEPTASSTPVASVAVSPQTDSLLVGTTLQLQAVLKDASGNTLARRLITWVSSDTSHGVVSTNGLVTARNPGSFTVTATSEGVVGGAFLNTQQRVVAVTLPDTFDLPRHDSVQFLPGLQGSSGGPLAQRALTWTSSDTTVARVSSLGVVTPRGYGLTTIRATTGALSDSCRLRVVPEPIFYYEITVRAAPILVGRPDTAGAIPIDSHGRVDTQAVVIWGSGDTSIMTVTPVGSAWPLDTNAVLHGHRPGAATLLVTRGAVVDTVHLVVAFPPGEPAFLQDTLTLPVGDQVQFPVLVRDSVGNLEEFEGVNVFYTVSDTSIVRALGNPAILTGLKPGRALLIGSWNSETSDTATVIVVPSGTRALQWSTPTSYAEASDSIIVQLAWDTTGGAPEPSPRAVTFTSTDTSILVPPAGFTLAGSANVTIHTHRAGTVMLRASTDSTSRVLGVQVLQVGPSKGTLSPRPVIVHVTDTVGFTFTTLDVSGIPRQYPDTFSLSDTSKASVSATGVVTFKQTGLVTVRARSGPVSDSVIVQIESAAGIRIDSIAPAVLRAGAGAVIYGSGFAPGAAVSVGGVPASVGTVTGGTAAITLPDASSLPCQASGSLIVTLNSGGQVAADSAVVSAADTFSLAVGGVQMLPAGTSQCLLVVQPGAVYRVNAVNSAGAASSFELRTGGSNLPALAGRPAASIPSSRSLPASRTLDSIAQVEGMHRRILEFNRTYAARHGSPVPALRAARASRTAGPAMSPSATINGVAQIRVPRIDLPDYCSASTTIQARLVYDGTHVKVFEDVNAPLAHTMDTAFVKLGQEFDSHMFPVLQTNFGNPLLLDSLLDGSGKMSLVFSPVVNNYGASAFVTDCDFYPETVAPSSNTTEILYGPVPTDGGTGYGAFTAALWLWQEPGAVVHEAEHLVSYAYHLSNAASFEELWLDEASATAATEIWDRPFTLSAWKTPANYAGTVGCEVRPNTCFRKPLAMFDAFAEFWQYAAANEYYTPLGPVSSADATFVGSGWGYLRWAIDQYAGSESAFLTALTQETSLTGTANLAARTGHSNAEMLSDWMMMWTLGGNGGVNQAFNFPSWDLTGMWSGLNTDFPSEFGNPFPAHPRTYDATDELFVDAVGPIPSGTGAYYQFTNRSTGGLLVRVTGLGGTPLPAGVVVQYLRMQ